MNGGSAPTATSSIDSAAISSSVESAVDSLTSAAGAAVTGAVGDLTSAAGGAVDALTSDAAGAIGALTSGVGAAITGLFGGDPSIQIQHYYLLTVIVHQPKVSIAHNEEVKVGNSTCSEVILYGMCLTSLTSPI